MSLLFVQYQGRKKSCKIVSPNVLLQSILEECAVFFGLDPSHCSLKYKRNSLDASLPFKFSGLASNTTIELVAVVQLTLGNVTAVKTTFCRVALTLEDNTSIGKSFMVSTSLFEMLEDFISTGELGNDFWEVFSDLIYMRCSYKTLEALQATTLSSLGLSGQAGRFQLRCNVKSKNASVHPQIVIDNIEDTTANGLDHGTKPSSTSALQHFTVSDIDIDACVSHMLSCNFDAVSVPALTVITKYLVNIATFPHDEKYHKINLENKIFREKVVPAQGSMDLLFALGFRKPHGSNMTSIYADSILMWSWTSQCPDSSTLSGNILCIMYKHLEALSVPLDGLRGRVVAASSSSSSSSAAAAAGVAQDSGSSGVVAVAATVHAHAESTLFAFDPYKTNIIRQAPQPTRGPSSTELELKQLNKRRLELEGDCSGVQRLSEVLFPAPDGSVASMTAYIEKDSTAVESNSAQDDNHINRALMKSIMGLSGNRGAYSGSNNGGDDDSFSQQFVSGSDAPLVTRAMRDLQKAKKERVYTKVLLRVRFSDRVCLQGYFHPRHTMQHVYEWVRDSLHVRARLKTTSAITVSGGDTCVAGEDTAYDKEDEDSVVVAHDEELYAFDLYTSPPRMVISRGGEEAGAATSSNGPAGDDAPTLMDLKFVPATLFHVSWKSTSAVYKKLVEMGCLPLTTNSNNDSQKAVVSSDALLPTSPGSMTMGRYLRQELLLKSEPKTALLSASTESGPRMFPVSTMLNAPPVTMAVKAASASSGSIHATAGGDLTAAEKTASADGKSSNKPKWFKL